MQKKYIVRLSKEERNTLREVVRKLKGSGQKVRVLSGWRYEQVRDNLTVWEFFFALARLGGHQNRKHDKRPGWLVLWRGWNTLQAMLDGAEAIRRKICG